MKLSPLDIRKQSFNTSLRGYSKDDVEAFLQMVSEQWEEMLDEQRRLEDQVEALEGKMEHYQQVEEALQEALQTARENSEQKIENAERKAKLMIQEAEAQGDEIKREAREEREVMRRQVGQLHDRRDEVVSRLRAFLMSEMELLLRFDDEDPDALREALPDHLAQHLGSAAPQPGGATPPPEGEQPSRDAAARDDAPAPSAAAGSASSSEPAPAAPPSAAAQDAAQQAPQATSAQAGSPRAEGYERHEEVSSGDDFDLPVSEDLSEATSLPSDEANPPSPEQQTATTASPSASAEAPAEKKPPAENESPTENASPEQTSPEEESEEAGDVTDVLDQFENAPPALSDAAAEQGDGNEEEKGDALESTSPTSRDGGGAKDSRAEPNPPEENRASEEVTASPDEIEKIRRILNDIDE